MNGTSNRILVTLNGQTLSVKRESNILKVIEQSGQSFKSPPLGAIVNNRLMGLYQILRGDSLIRTVDYSSKEGANIYRRSASLILLEAITELFPTARLEIGQSLGDGYYYRVSGKELCAETIETIESRMRQIVKEGRTLQPRPIAVEEAIEYFAEIGYPEKVLLLRQRPVAEVPMVHCGKSRDIAYGPFLHSTALCPEFALVPMLPGFVLNFPDPKGHVTRILPPQPKLFSAYRETRAWNERLGVWNVGQLNEACIDGSISEIIRVSEGLQEKKIAHLADEISQRAKNVRLVLIAGPSSSGKTTFTKRLAVQLRVNGIRPLTLSLDNYYMNRADTPKNPDGTYDFETIDALDLPLFNQHLCELLEGREVQTPLYDFVSGERKRDKTLPMKLADDEVLIAEGIHGLNPRLTSAVPSEAKFRIYVSALTQLTIDEHNRIFTSDVRLLRRIVRDRLFRGYSAAKTIHQWTHVRAGENKWIFPFQEEADELFNTALVYEQAALKPFLSRFLAEVKPDNPAYVETFRLSRFLSLFIPIFTREVPPNSILREFVGESVFHY